MRPNTSRILLFVVMAAALVGYATISNRITDTAHDNAPRREELKQQLPSSASIPAKKATLNPGRVVQLHTSKGLIEFVLFEQDCPKTTKRIADLVSKKAYDGVKFGRVEKDDLIQTDEAKVKVKPMGCELVRGMTHAKGSVGMARGESHQSNTSQFYILLKPHLALDLEYTNFGRLINGMDVAMKIEVGDVIRRAALRELTEGDKKRFFEILRIESDAKVN